MNTLTQPYEVETTNVMLWFYCLPLSNRSASFSSASSETVVKLIEAGDT